MKYLSFNYNKKNVEDLLANAPCTWLATGSYGIELVLKGECKSTRSYICVRERLKQKEYLSSNGATSTNILPNLRLIAIRELPKAYPKNNRVVNISFNKRW